MMANPADFEGEIPSLFATLGMIKLHGSGADLLYSAKFSRSIMLRGDLQHADRAIG